MKSNNIQMTNRIPSADNGTKPHVVGSAFRQKIKLLGGVIKPTKKTIMVQENAPSNIKEFRLEADCLINSTKYLRTSREVSLAHTNLQRAKMWLGKALGETGTLTPYPNSENPNNDTIEPQADHAENNLISRWQVLEDTHTARVKDFRFVCQIYIDHFKGFIAHSESAGKYYDLYLQQSLLAMEEAKMWFGWELDRIRIIKGNEGAENSEPQRELPL